MARPLVSLIGYKRKMLTVIGFSHISKSKSGNNIYYWNTHCECGNIRPMSSKSLKCKGVVSCGCYKQANCQFKFKHGLKGTKEYKVWCGINKRVNSKEKRYAKYVKMGMHEEWKTNFLSFLEHIGKIPSDKHTVDRIDTTKGYYPNNVRWRTMKEQNRNSARNVIIEYNGEKKCISEWAEYLNINSGTLYSRLNRGMSVDVAFNQPIKKRTIILK